MERKYKLTGVISLFDLPSGFVYPVFEDKKGKRYFGICDDNSLTFNRFGPVKEYNKFFRGLDSFENISMEINGMVYTTKSEPIYGFMFDENNLYLGNTDNMYEFLIAHDFSDDSNIQKEVEECKEEIIEYQKLKAKGIKM